MTEAQKALIVKAKENGGSVKVDGRGEKVTARRLMRQGIFKLVGAGVYGLV